MSAHAIGHVHEPEQTLANTLISFRRLPQGEKKCPQIPPSAPTKAFPQRRGIDLYGDSDRCHRNDGPYIKNLEISVFFEKTHSRASAHWRAMTDYGGP